MAKTIESFWCVRPSKWPDTVRAAFRENITEMGCAYFPDSSAVKFAFLKMCRDLSLEIQGPQRHLDIIPEELPNYPFYYLVTQMDGAIRGYAYLDYSHGCVGGPQIRRCSTGVIQNKPIALGGQTPAADIVELYADSPFKLFVVSRRLMTTITSLNPTGVEFVACDGGDTYFQMRIRARTLAPPNVGAVKISTSCPTCETLYGYRTEHPATFRSDSLAPADFQVYDMIQSGSNIYRLSGEVSIISARIQMLLVNGQFTGHAPYYTDPPVEFGIVGIDERH